MTFFGHALLFFVAGFLGYLRIVSPGHAFGAFFFITLPIAGVYFLGWWALLTFIVGTIFGGLSYSESVKSARDRGKD